MKKYIFSSLISLLLSANLLAQGMSVVSINRYTGGFTSIATTPHNVSSIFAYGSYASFNPINKHFLFSEIDRTASPYQFYYNTIDTDSGHFIAKVHNGLAGFKNIMGLEYDQRSGKLYGLYEDYTAPQLNYHYAFVEIDPYNGNFTIIDSFPSIHHIHEQQSHTLIHQDSSWYIFSGTDTLYTLDLNTGNILYKAYFPISNGMSDNVIGFEYDDSTSNIYGLYWNNAHSMQHLVTIDPKTASHIVLDSFPNIDEVIFPSQNFAIDTKNRHYIFVAEDKTDTFRLYTIDLNSFQIIANPVYDYRYNADTLLPSFYLRSDGDGGLLGMTWMRGKLSTSITQQQTPLATKIYPNPMNDQFTIQLPFQAENISIQLFSMNGQLVRSLEYKGTNEVIIERAGLSNGLYFIHVIADGQQGIEKVIVQ